MVKGVSKELRREIRSVLGEFLNGRPNKIVSTGNWTSDMRRDAINYLADIDAIRDEGVGGYRLTALGREYWDELNAPRRYWFKQNWFPALVAFGTILFGGASAVANIVNLVL